MTMERNMVSVIIPVYNGEQTIERACSSVFRQSYPHLEVIVVDDGSRDRTGGVLEELSGIHPNLVAIRQENGGVCSARNTGLEAAKGEFIMFLDADDALAPDCVEKLVKVIREENADIAAGPCLRMYPDGTAKLDSFPPAQSGRIWEGSQGLQESLRDHPATYSVWGNLFRRETVEHLRFVEGKRMHEDSFFYFQVLCADVKLVLTDITTVHYYLTENSASRSRFSEKYLDMLYFADRKMEIVQTSYPELIPLGKNMLVKANMALLRNMALVRKHDYPEVEQQCLRTVRENARYFIPALSVDKVVFFAIRLRLFWLFKWAYSTWKGR